MPKIFLVVLFCALIFVNAEHRHHHKKSLRPSISPSARPSAKPISPTWARTPEQYAYDAAVDYAKAVFDYANKGAGADAEANEDEAKLLKSLGLEEYDQEHNITNLNKKTHAPHVLHTFMPTKKPTTPKPTGPTISGKTQSPSWQFSPEQYFYYASIYYARAKFDYDNFPHVGPAFYAAQTNEALGKFYEARGNEEKSEEE